MTQSQWSCTTLSQQAKRMSPHTITLQWKLTSHTINQTIIIKNHYLNLREHDYQYNDFISRHIQLPSIITQQRRITILTTQYLTIRTITQKCTNNCFSLTLASFQETYSLTDETPTMMTNHQRVFLKDLSQQKHLLSTRQRPTNPMNKWNWNFIDIQERQ